MSELAVLLAAVRVTLLEFESCFKKRRNQTRAEMHSGPARQGFRKPGWAAGPGAGPPGPGLARRAWGRPVGPRAGPPG